MLDVACNTFPAAVCAAVAEICRPAVAITCAAGRVCWTYLFTKMKRCHKDRGTCSMMLLSALLGLYGLWILVVMTSFFQPHVLQAHLQVYQADHMTPRAMAMVFYQRRHESSLLVEVSMFVVASTEPAQLQKQSSWIFRCGSLLWFHGVDWLYYVVPVGHIGSSGWSNGV